ncbi:phosphatase PAP2 family protein [Yinghuangia seranimata]|uniref:phosphatase PAP2 family protein n=1 Tax=Yinghuangia seranimata TaxID=408067 RepID=UPI00248CBE36|nr:phosphatase PAP2 family protein [Yinghuangia seranimata]MDI2131913.1 phosphatase PAP2 family protein [Yinghuangia seranimata]
MHSFTPRPWHTVCALTGAAVFTVLLVLVVLGWGPLHRVDVRVATDLHTWVLEHPVRKDVLRFLTNWVWDPWTFRALVAVAVVVLLVRGDRRTAAWAAAVMIVGGTAGTLVKVAVARDRPMFTDPVATANGWSFPSGHALNGMLGCGVLLVVLLPWTPRLLRPLLWAAAVVSVLGVGFTRIALGVHYLSDVVAGWALGVVVLAAGWLLFAVLWDPAEAQITSHKPNGNEIGRSESRPAA